MEALSDTQWDVTIAGTGLAQSLLALALSRSGKKVLHVDKNSYYGGSEAAFSLQEAGEWVERLKKEPRLGPFEDVSIHLLPDSATEQNRLASSRAYTLSLSPFLIYTRSKLLPSLVSSKVYRQLEFQAVGSWWIYRSSNPESEGTSDSGNTFSPHLRRVPSSREDIFADDAISLKAKRTLIKFLRSISQPLREGDDDVADHGEDLNLPFPGYLTSRFQVPSELHDPILALSLTQRSPPQTPATFAVPRIQRHLGSIGVFGPGFGSLVAKWGGGSEIAQVGCRALAVGGGVYVLNRGIVSVETPKGEADTLLEFKLSDGESIRSKFVVGSHWDLPTEADAPGVKTGRISRSVSIVSSPLRGLFPVTAEGGPVPAGAVVLLPGREIAVEGTDDIPVYLLVHSSDTGECPEGQYTWLTLRCSKGIIYGNVSVAGHDGQLLLDAAVRKLLQSFADGSHPPAVLWSLRYTQVGVASEDAGTTATVMTSPASDKLLFLPPASLDLAFDDGTIDAVKTAWKTILGDEARDDDFMTFDDRDPNVDDE